MKQAVKDLMRLHDVMKYQKGESNADRARRLSKVFNGISEHFAELAVEIETEWIKPLSLPKKQ